MCFLFAKVTITTEKLLTIFNSPLYLFSLNYVVNIIIVLNMMTRNKTSISAFERGVALLLNDNVKVYVF